MGYLGQDLLIENLNNEFKKRKFPSQFRLNERGVCNGLAIVYAQHALQGTDKEVEFFKLLELIASGELNSETQHGLQKNAILFFTTKVLLAFQPSKYDLSKNQSTGMEMLNINGVPLRSSFDFALAAPDKQWSDVIAKIGLQDDEVMVVQSLNHTISIRKVNNEYRVYDPNYEQGIKEFATEEALVRELHGAVFDYKKGNLGMQVHVVRHPEAVDRAIPFPDIKELYQDHLSSENSTAKIGSKTFDTLVVAAGIIKDPQVIDDLLNLSKPGPEAVLAAAEQAALKNNTTALVPLLKKLEAEEPVPAEKFRSLINIAIGMGCLEAYQQLETYFRLSYAEGNLSYLLVKAAHGGNPEILKKVLGTMESYQKKYVAEMVTNDLTNGSLRSTEAGIESDKQVYSQLYMNEIMGKGVRTAISAAIAKGNTECIEILLDQLKLYSQTLNEKQYLDYLMEAIIHNQPFVLEQLIALEPEKSKKLLEYLSMTALSVDQTELDVLKILQANGVRFSPQAEAIIQKKEENKYLSFMTMVNIVINHIQNFFGKRQIAYDETRLLTMKKNECMDIINTMTTKLSKIEKLDNEAYQKYTQIIRDNKNKLDNTQDFAVVTRIVNRLRSELCEIPELLNIDGLDFSLDDEEETQTHVVVCSDEIQEQSDEQQFEKQDCMTSRFKEQIADLKKDEDETTNTNERSMVDMKSR